MANAEEIISRLHALGVDVHNLCTSTHSLQANDVFLAMPGTHGDGRNYMREAIDKGASAILWEKENFTWDSRLPTPQMGVPRLREVAGELAHLVYGKPSEHLKVIAVTGTNGKTTVTHWLAQALARINRPCGVIGTLGFGVPPDLAPLHLTTPDAPAVHRLLKIMQQQDLGYVAMEASSIALHQHRLNGVRLQAAAFLNLSRDHLDYHSNLTAYAKAKRQLFDLPGLSHAILNLDEPLGLSWAEELQYLGIGIFGITHTERKFAKQWRVWRGAVDADTLTLTGPNHQFSVPTAIASVGFAQNLLMTAALLDALDVIPSTPLLTDLAQPAGRMEVIHAPQNPLVFVDFAHTPNALRLALEAARKAARDRGGKLLCLFGCGGERDQGKRPLMGEVAAREADVVMLTSDNPRGEDPQFILAQIRAGITQTSKAMVYEELDRARAIANLINQAKDRDVILIAGKGHEKEQIIGQKKIPFSDAEHVRHALGLPQASSAGSSSRLSSLAPKVS